MTRELFGVFLILAVAGTTSFAQQQDDLTSPSANGTPGYVRMPVGDLSMPVGPLSSTPLLVFPSGAATSAGVFPVMKMPQAAREAVLPQRRRQAVEPARLAVSSRASTLCRPLPGPSPVRLAPVKGAFFLSSW